MEKYVCPTGREKITGVSAIYDCLVNPILSEGIVVVAAIVEGSIFIFQVSRDVAYLDESLIPPAPGSILCYTAKKDAVIVNIEKISSTIFSVSECRFPTEDEFVWYENNCTV